MQKNYPLLEFLIVVLIASILLVSPCVSACDCNRYFSPKSAPELYNFFIDVIETQKQMNEENPSDFDIHTLNKKEIIEESNFKMKQNFTDIDSLYERCGLVEPIDWWVNARFDPCLPTRDLPESFDWRDVNGTDFTTPIKNQGSCGSCWAFATVAPLECNIKIKDGDEVDLSEQWLVNCNQDGWDCDGGWWAHDYHEWKNDSCNGTGAVLESYCPYTGQDDTCGCPYPHDYLINNWSYIGTYNELPPINSIKQAIMDYGPVSAAVCTNTPFHNYDGGIFTGPSCSNINHAVTLVGWNDSQGSEGVWILRNSWGTDWGEDGYMRIEYGVSYVGYAACYVNYTGTPKIKINLPDGVPELINPGEPTNITVQIEESYDSYINGSGKIYYRDDNGTFINSSLMSVGGNLYEAILPPPSCGENPEYFFSAEGNISGVTYSPSNAPNQTYWSLVGDLTTVFFDDFETDLGWTVQNDSNLTDGAWERGIPVGGGDRGDPPSDYNGSGRCYVTNNTDNNSDVDDGRTWLISPAINLSEGIDAKVDYALWYTNDFGGNPNNDLFKVYVSNDDGGNWTLVETIGPNTRIPHGWYKYSFALCNYVIPTSKVRFCFEASDLDNGSVVEAGIDNFSVKLLKCCNQIQISELLPNWNFVSLPFNNSVNKTDLLITHNGTEYSWQEAINNNILLGFFYHWNRGIQNYEPVDKLNPGFGYWIYAYKDCEIWAQGINTIIKDNYLTDVFANWNIIGLPDNISVEKENITIHFDGTNYTWQEAVINDIILGFIFKWNELNQNYEQSDILNPGQAYWMYSYQNCKLLKPIN